MLHLLQTDCSGIEVMPNATVSATRGEGNYFSLNDAVKNIPSNAAGRYVIYVKAGIYNENVLISRSSVSLIGDGIGRTIIRSSRSRLGTGHTIQDSGAVSKLNQPVYINSPLYMLTSKRSD